MSNYPVFESKKQFSSDLNIYLNKLDTAFSSQVLQTNLPLLGNRLRSSSLNGFFSQVRSSVQNQIQASSRNFGYSEDVAAILFNALGNTPNGLGVLQDLNGDNVVTIADIQIDEQTFSGDGYAPNGGYGYGGYVDFSLRLGRSSTFNTTLTNDLGLPKLGLGLNGNVNVELGYSFDLNFGYELGYDENADPNDDLYDYPVSTFYAETKSPKEISINVRANPDIFGTGKLGIFPIQATNQGSTLEASFSINIKDSADADTRLSITELLGLSDDNLIDTSLAGRVDLKVHLKTNFPSQARFPSLSADFRIDWSLNSSELNPGQPQVLGGIPKIEFNNVKLDIGTFLNNFVSPILGEIQKVTKPVQPVINFLTKPLPVISKFAKRNITMLDIAELASKANPELPKPNFAYIKAVAEVVSLSNSVPNGQNLFVNLGSFSLGSADVRSLSFSLAGAAPTITNAAPSWSNQLQGSRVFEFITKTQGNSPAGNFDFPILTDPNTAFNLLLGKTHDTKLLTYRMPPLSFTGSYSQFASILGPLGVTITGTLGANINFEFGFDAFGLEQYSKSARTEDLFSGFYVDADPRKPPHVNVFAGLDAGPSVNLAIASFTIAGGLVGTIDFRLKDDGDLKVRADELARNFQGDLLGRDLFNTSGAVIVGLKARATVIGIGSYTENIAEVTLLQYGAQPSFKEKSGKSQPKAVQSLTKLGLLPLIGAAPLAAKLVRDYGPTLVKAIQKAGVGKALNNAANKGKQAATKATKAVSGEMKKARKAAIAKVARSGLNPVQAKKRVERITVKIAAPAIKRVVRRLRF